MAFSKRRLSNICPRVRALRFAGRPSVRVPAPESAAIVSASAMAQDDDTDPRCRLGVLAFGDSITNGGGELQWGVALQSWALWTARGLGLPYTGYAVDGATVTDVVSRQIPAFQRVNADPSARYQVGCLYIGVNDVRRRDSDPAVFAAGHEGALAFLHGRCGRVLAVTAPLRLGVPAAGPKATEHSAIVRAAAERPVALIMDLSD